MAESVWDYGKRPIRYSLIDGIDEMLIGFFLVTSTIFTHAENLASEGSIWHWKYTVLVANALLLSVFLLARKLLKERVTYPRTGYVKYRHSRVRSMIGAVIGFGVAAIAVSTFVTSHPPERDRNLILLGSLFSGALYIFFFIHLTKMYRLWRWLVAIVIVAGPLAVYTILANARDISTLSSGVTGACFFASGVVAFLSYLRNTKPAAVQSREMQ